MYSAVVLWMYVCLLAIKCNSEYALYRPFALAKDFVTIGDGLSLEVPAELFTVSVAYDGPLASFDVNLLSEWCHEATLLNEDICLADLNSLVYQHVYSNSATTSKSLLSRLTDVYLGFLTRYSKAVEDGPPQSVCLLGDYSSDITVALLSLTGNRTLNLFISLDSMEDIQRLELEQLIASSDKVAVYDVSDVTRYHYGSVCDVMHIRGSANPLLFHALVNKWRNGFSTIILESNDDTVLDILKASGVRMNWLLNSDLDSEYASLRVGFARLMPPGPFDHFRKAQAMKDTDSCPESCRFFNNSDSVYHYVNWTNTVNTPLYDRMRKDNYKVNIDLQALDAQNIAAQTVTDPNEVKLFVTFCFNGELMLPLHLEYLYEHVDAFIIIEARMTHSGRAKSHLFIDQYHRMFEPYLDKIQFLVIDTFPAPPPDWCRLFEQHLASLETHRNPEKTVDEYCATWFRENYQRDIAADFLNEVYPNTAGAGGAVGGGGSGGDGVGMNQKYLLIVTDADEIMSLPDLGADTIKSYYQWFSGPYYFNMKMFYYNFHHQLNAGWVLSFIINDKGIRELYPLSELRTISAVRSTMPCRSWHLSYFSSIHNMVKKIESFSHMEYDSETFKNTERIAEKVQQGSDLYGRPSDIVPFSDWSSLPPQFLSFHPIVMRYQRDRYEHSHLLHARVWISVVAGDDSSTLVFAYGLKEALGRIGFTKVSVVPAVTASAVSGGVEGGSGLGVTDVSEYVRVWQSGSRDINEDGLQLQIIVRSTSRSNASGGYWVLPRSLVVNYSPYSQMTTLHSASGDVDLPSYASCVKPRNNNVGEVSVDAVGATTGGDYQYIDVFYLSSSSSGDSTDGAITTGEDEVASLLTASAESDKRTPLNVLISATVDSGGVISTRDPTVRENLLRHSKVVVLTVASKESLDFGLINYLMALRKCIVLVDTSESLELSESLGSAMWVVSGRGAALDDLYHVCKGLVVSDERRARLEQRAAAVHESIQSDVGVLRESVFRCLQSSEC